MTLFLVPAAAVAVVALGCLFAGWEINRPDTGKRAKPLSADDERIIRWAKALNPKNVSRPGTTSGSPPESPPAGPGHHHAHRAGGVRGDLGEVPSPGPVRSGEACEPCTVNNCGPGCKCACHWGDHTADLTAILPASDTARIALYDAGIGTDDLIARAGRVLAGVS